MKTKIVTIDALAARCGNFEDRNGGYECRHPNNDQYPGECYSFSCPLANRCELQDVKKYAPYDYRNFYSTEAAVDEAELVIYHYEDGDPIGEAL